MHYENLEIPVGHAQLEETLLNLALLLNGLIDQLKLSSSDEAITLTRASTGSLRPANGHRSLALTDVQLELIVTFLLVYYRDGAADVDHLDIEVQAERGDADVTLTVDRYKPPLGPDEIKALLASEGSDLR